MKQVSNEYGILTMLAELPQKILQSQGEENVAEIVLFELAQESCFNLDKAVYVVDNPDFDCLKGVVAYYSSEIPQKTAKEEYQTIYNYFSQSPFNQKARMLQKNSLMKKGKTDKEIAQSISQDMNMNDIAFYSFPIKHGNKGMLVYQKKDKKLCECNYLLSGLCLLGLCPVY